MIRCSVANATVCAVLVLTIGSACVHAQTDSTAAGEGAGLTGDIPSGAPDSEHPVDGTRLAIVGGTLAASMLAIHFYQENGWWKDNRSPFHFREDLVYGRGVDKIGHFYGASAITFVFSKALQWAHLREEDALLLGAGASVLFQTYVEVRDGFSAWGFDRVDFAANVGGAFYPVIQYHVPFMKNFNLKFSYHPSDLLNNPGGIGFRGQEHILFDDYEGQTFWLSMSVNNLLPDPVEPLWPDWLAIAVGYGARDVAGPDSHSIILIGFDYDMTRIIPQSTGFLRTLSEALNFIRLPAPAVRISPTAIWYGLYF